MTNKNSYEDIFLQEEMKEIESVKDNETVVAKLKEDKAEIWREILDINAKGAELAHEYIRLSRELSKLKKRFEAKRFLFWDMIEQADERFESLDQRGKTLAVRKDEDENLVVVEFDIPQSNLGGFLLMPPPDQDLQ
jgi:predicted  nucleic acid-binding Zn-ribbon protein